MKKPMLITVDEKDAKTIREGAKKDRRNIGDFVSIAVEHYAKEKGLLQDENRATA